ncbi:MAG: winged helix-turn-helix domain-containing protein [Terracidiphilus sp.]
MGFTQSGSADEAASRLSAMELLQMESNRVERYRDARLEIDFHSQGVLLDGEAVHLTRMEFALVAQLARTAGDIVSRDALMLHVWGYGPEIHSRTMDVHLRRLRVKLGSYSKQHIETVFGLGYRLQPCHAARALTQAAGA